MKTLSVLQLLLGVSLLAAAMFVPLSDGTMDVSSVDTMALHDVTGMAFQGQSQEPVEVEPNGKRCVPGGGSRCDPNIPTSWCQTTILPIILGSGCGAAEDKYCGYITSGPFSNDKCTTSGASENSHCVTSPTGACAQVREGTCYSRPTGGFYQCKCDYAEGNTTYNGREECQ